MANKVSFIIQLKDQFGRTAEKVRRQFDGIQKSADKANKSVQSFSKKASESLNKFGKKAATTGAAMTAGITVPIGLMASSMIKAASDAEETANKFNAVFSDVGAKANSVSKEFAANFGITNSTAQELISNTGDLLVGFGFAGDEALELSKKVNELASDLTSFQNVEGGVTSASNALTKALLGETESAKSLGIVIRQNDKDFRNRVKTISRFQRKTRQQAKAIAILEIATRQSGKAVGDVSRTWDDYASVQRRAMESNKEMRRSFGEILIPIANKLQNLIIKITKGLSNLQPGTKEMILIFAALAAVAGPLVLVLGGIAISIAALMTPIGLAVAAVGLLAVAGTLLALRWEGVLGGLTMMWRQFSDFVHTQIKAIGDTFTAIFEGRFIDAVRTATNFAIRAFNALIAPISFIGNALGFENLKIPEVSAKSAPSKSFNGSLEANVNVSASPGSKIDSSSVSGRSQGFDLGYNMVIG